MPILQRQKSVRKMNKGGELTVNKKERLREFDKSERQIGGTEDEE